MHAAASPTIAGADLKRLLDSSDPPLVLDVREPDEFAEWRIPGAVNVPLRALLSDPPRHAPPGRVIVTVCAHGVRSARAASALRAIGATASNLAGGMVAWNSVYDEAEVDAGIATVVQLRRVGKGCMGYLVGSSREAIAVDATRDIDAWEGAAVRRGWRIVAVLDTHAHADHVSGGRLLAKAVDVPYRGPAEAKPEKSVENGEEIRIGQASLRALATPGHTPGSLTYLVGDVALTGDTLFVESVGRPDLGQDTAVHAASLWDTLHNRLLALPAATRVLPAHVGEAVPTRSGEAVVASLADLRARLPALSFGKEEFVRWVEDAAGAKPANFDLIKAINVGRMPLPSAEETAEMEAGPNRCAV